jgi:hypothetical protein
LGRDDAVYESQIKAADERISRARARAGREHASLTDKSTTWFRGWALATARRIVEDQHERTTENPSRAWTLRDALQSMDWAGSMREIMAARSLTAHLEAGLETDRLVPLRLMFARTSEQDAPDWFRWVVDRLTDVFAEVVSAHGYVPVLYEMAQVPTRRLASVLPRELLAAASAFEAATIELVDAHMSLQVIRSARSRAFARSVWTA